MTNIKPLQILESRQRGQPTRKAIVADIKHRYIDKLSKLDWETAIEVVANEENLLEAAHLADRTRNAAMEVVIRKGHNGDSGVSNGIRDEGTESIVV